MLAAQEFGHLHHQRQHFDLAAQGVHHLRLRVYLENELDMLVFAPTEQKLHVSSGEQIAHTTWFLAGTQDSSGPTQYVELWTTQLERSTGQKLDM